MGAQKIREQGNQHFKAGQYEEAIRFYSEALKSDPSNAGLLSNRAAANLMLKDWDGGFQDSFAAVKSDPSNIKACERCARSLLLANRLNDAMSFCQQRMQ